MYFPYFRGKQNELITIRENAQLLKDAGFVPIIEPVKESLSGLMKTLTAVNEAEGEVIVIVNPYYGDYSRNGDDIVALLTDEFDGQPNITFGLLLSENTSLPDALALYARLKDQRVAFVHAGFTEAKMLVEGIGEDINEMRHIFHEDNCGKLYQKHFKNADRILLRDGFEKRKNREHPPIEFFSDLHATYDDENMNGFGDFLIVGDEYSDSGGPAYAIAIHLTCIDSDKDDGMYIHHFKSIRQDDPKDPAGKFAEALQKMVDEVKRPGTMILHTAAVEEFLGLYEREHFPGLGYVKKISMQHHLETLASYFESN